jgi:DNA/RNA endonuclease YhcR with UshA esterase domain
MKTYLVAIRDVRGFTIIDNEGYELEFDLKEGSRVKIYEHVETYKDEITVKLFNNEDIGIVSAQDFKIVQE